MITVRWVAILRAKLAPVVLDGTANVVSAVKLAVGTQAAFGLTATTQALLFGGAAGGMLALARMQMTRHAVGKAALEGGAAWSLAGVAMHFSVALFWSALFLVALRNSAGLRRAISTIPGAVIVAAIYGMSIWLFMSFVVIPTMVHRPPNITTKFWIQLIGHIPFVALPMVLLNRRPLELNDVSRKQRQEL